MDKLSHWGKYLFSGFLLGFTLAVLGGHWPWLAMRINTAFFIPLGALLGLIIGVSKIKPRSSWLLLLDLFWCATLLLVYHSQLDALTVLPAILMKQGFGLGFLSIDQSNLVLISVFFLGNTGWLISEFKRFKGSTNDEEEEICAN